MRVTVIDNYDSFTYNLVQMLGTLGARVTVLRNDSAGVEEVLAAAPRRIVISPGPCTPAEAGCSVELVRAAAGRVPVLGVCLGHQAVATAFGGRVVRSDRPVHGKATPVIHDGSGLFRGIPSPLTGGRYHSLVVVQEGLPACLRVTARTADGAIMALRHVHHPVWGLQFHPESILTPWGERLMINFLDDSCLEEGAA